MIVEAAKKGANAVLGVRYEFLVIAQYHVKVLCYGMGVVLAQARKLSEGDGGKGGGPRFSNRTLSWLP